MRVVVLGAGLLGVASAYYLQQLGHEVIVVDRHATPAAKARGRVDAGRSAAAARLLRQSAARRAGSAKWARLYAAGLRRRLARLLDRAIGAPRNPTRSSTSCAWAPTAARACARCATRPACPRARAAPGLLSFYTDAVAFDARTARASHWYELGCEERLLSADEALHIEPALQAVRGELAGATYRARRSGARPGAVRRQPRVPVPRGRRALPDEAHGGLAEGARRAASTTSNCSTPHGQPRRPARPGLRAGARHRQRDRMRKSWRSTMPLRFVREYIVTMPIKDRGPRAARRAARPAGQAAHHAHRDARRRPPAGHRHRARQPRRAGRARFGPLRRHPAPHRDAAARRGRHGACHRSKPPCTRSAATACR